MFNHVGDTSRYFQDLSPKERREEIIRMISIALCFFVCFIFVAIWILLGVCLTEHIFGSEQTAQGVVSGKEYSPGMGEAGPAWFLYVNIPSPSQNFVNVCDSVREAEFDAFQKGDKVTVSYKRGWFTGWYYVSHIQKN